MNEFGDTPRSARQRRKYFRHLLHKCLAPAFDVAASPTAQPQLQRHVRALDWKVLKSPLTPAVPVRRLFSAARANAGTSPNCSDNSTTADPVDTQNTNARPRRQPRFCLHPAGIGRGEVDQEGRSSRALRQSQPRWLPTMRPTSAAAAISSIVTASKPRSKNKRVAVSEML